MVPPPQKKRKKKKKIQNLINVFGDKTSFWGEEEGDEGMRG